MPQPSLYLATSCYGGLAQARYLRSLMALRRACAERAIALHIDLTGGEALSSRGRALTLAKFLSSDATHLLFADAEAAFTAEEVFELLQRSDAVASVEDRLFLIPRDVAQRTTEAHPGLRARMGDVRGASAAPSPMLFEALIAEPGGAYLPDLAAFARRQVGKSAEASVDP